MIRAPLPSVANGHGGRARTEADRRRFGNECPGEINAPEPNTWRELLQATEGARKVGGNSGIRQANEELVAALKARGADVTPVPVYVYDLPEDIEPLRSAARDLARRAFEVTLFTTSQQVVYLMQVAREMNLEDAVRDRDSTKRHRLDRADDNRDAG